MIMNKRVAILNSFYNQYDEENRLIRSRCGQLEYATTMHYIHKYCSKGSKIAEIGAGTGRYSIALAKEGYDVTAIELVEKNLGELKNNSKGIKNIKAYQGDATDLSRFEDDSFDVTLSFGPLYHLYDKDDVNKAIDEAIRVTKPNGVILFAFIGVYGIMDANYLVGNWAQGLDMNFTKDMEIRHFQDQLFTGYDIKEFENLFTNKNIAYLTTVGVDGSLESLQRVPDFKFSDEDFKSYIKWHINLAEKRELLGKSNHLLYICKRK